MVGVRMNGATIFGPVPLLRLHWGHIGIMENKVKLLFRV